MAGMIEAKGAAFAGWITLECPPLFSVSPALHYDWQGSVDALLNSLLIALEVDFAVFELMIAQRSVVIVDLPSCEAGG